MPKTNNQNGKTIILRHKYSIKYKFQHERTIYYPVTNLFQYLYDFRMVRPPETPGNENYQQLAAYRSYSVIMGNGIFHSRWSCLSFLMLSLPSHQAPTP